MAAVSRGGVGRTNLVASVGRTHRRLGVCVPRPCVLVARTNTSRPTSANHHQCEWRITDAAVLRVREALLPLRSLFDNE